MTEQPNEAIARKIAALLNTSGRTEEEAALCIAKAQELLEKYNLSQADLGHAKAGAHGNTRKDNKKKGGLYKWQRTLWEDVAKLNFCYYTAIKGLERGAKYEHRIIGSSVNVLSTEQMAQYLQDTIERIAQTWAKERGYRSVFVREAIAYREGMAHRLSERLKVLRDERIAEQERKKQEEGMRSRHPGAAPSSTALTIVEHSRNEEGLNLDHLYGYEPGTHAARWAEEEARMAKIRADAEKRRQERLQWEKDNPEEAAAQKAKEDAYWEKYFEEAAKREERNAKRRKGSSYYDRKDTPEEARAKMHQFREGMQRAEDIGLDQQIDKANRKEMK